MKGLSQRKDFVIYLSLHIMILNEKNRIKSDRVIPNNPDFFKFCRCILYKQGQKYVLPSITSICLRHIRVHQLSLKVKTKNVCFPLRR